MITPDGWLTWAERWPNPGFASRKVDGWHNTGRMYLPHSAVGYWGGFKGRLMDRPETDPTARASVHGWIPYEDNVIQILPFTAECWSSGSPYPNRNGIAFETEGGYKPENEPLTETQIEHHVHIIRDLAEWKQWAPRRPVNGVDKTATLYEHRECTRFGSLPTACPSDRIPWAEILRRLQGGEDDMATIISRPGTNFPQNYLVVGKAMEFLESREQRELAAEAYGISAEPRAVSQAAFDWLAKRAGLSV